MRTTIETFFATAARQGAQTAQRFNDGGAWKQTTWADHAANVRRAGRAFIGLGVPQGGSVAIIGPNRPEWITAALGAQCAGGAPVGIYTTSTADQAAYIIAHAEAKVAVVHDEAQLKKLRSQAKVLPALKTIVLMTGTPDAPDAITWKDFLARADQTPDAEVDARIAATQGGDVASLIYTSGTTGLPKAVMLTHDNLLLSIQKHIAYIGLDAVKGEVILSYLPLSHIAEQLLSIWAGCLIGGTLGFCENLDAVGDHLREVRPTLFFAVPRVWEKIQAKMVQAGQANPWLKKKIAAWARGVGLKANHAKIAGEPLPGGYKLAHKLVFSKVRERLGLDRCKLAVSGAAAISRSTLDFFLSLDIPIHEVYGMSESVGVMSINIPGAARIGSVGKCVPGFELKLAADGEILAKGPHVFKGYYKNPEATAETIVDGWLHSGDVGELDKDGFLRITDRKKELFKTAGGKYIAPQYLEGLAKAIPGIGQVAVVGGDSRKYVAALFVLDAENAPRVAQTLGVSGTLAQVAAHPAFVAHVERELAKVNSGLAKYESIKKFKLLGAEFTVDGGELTPTMKLKRKVINEKYKVEIDALFAEDAAAAASAA